ncbi:MAG: LysR family transcriptional regulator [Syntrophales bacterium]|nr:LysR family transcriptional regulator [Syntrophales bacterium]
MNMQQLHYFKKIAEMEHYTKAANALSITQPCLSYAISELEKELGAPLFYKTGRNIKLTRYGDMFLIHVKNALGALDMGKTEIQELVSPNKGNIIISHISSMNMIYIPFLIRKFYENQAHKDITLDFQENPTIKIIENLKLRKVDIGFGTKMEDEELEFFSVYEEDLVLIVGKNHSLSKQVEIELKETQKYDYIAYGQNTGIRRFIDKVFVEAGATCKIVREVEDNAMITGMVSSGLGIAVVPRMFGNEYYNVKSLEIKGINSSRQMCMMWMKGAYLSPVAQKFIEFVKSCNGYIIG